MALPIFKDDTKPSEMVISAEYCISQILNIKSSFIPYLDYNVLLRHNFDSQRLTSSFTNETDSGYWLPIWEIYWGDSSIPANLAYCGSLTPGDGNYIGFDGVYEWFDLIIDDFHAIIDPERHPYLSPGPIAWTNYINYNSANNLPIRYKVNTSDPNDVRLVTPSITWTGSDPGWADIIKLTHNIPDLEWISSGIDNFNAKPDSYILIKTESDDTGNGIKYKLIANGNKLIVSTDIIEDNNDTYQSRIITYSKHTEVYDDDGEGHITYLTSYTEDSIVDNTIIKQTWMGRPIKPEFKLLTTIKNNAGLK